VSTRYNYLQLAILEFNLAAVDRLLRRRLDIFLPLSSSFVC